MKENKENKSDLSCTGAWQRLHRDSMNAVKAQLLTSPNLYITTAGSIFGGCCTTLLSRTLAPPADPTINSMIGEVTIRTGYTLLTAVALTYLSNLFKRSSQELDKADDTEVKIRIR